MPAAPALIVRHDPRHTVVAVEEIRRVMRAIGEPDALVKTTEVAGNLKVIPEGDAHEAQEMVTRLCADRPELFAHTSNWTVVDQFVPTDLASIRRAVAAYQRDIGASDSWKIAVRPAGSALHRQNVIDAVAPLIHNAPVDLENPAKEIRIDILGDETGVGLLDRSELFPGHLEEK